MCVTPQYTTFGTHPDDATQNALKQPYRPNCTDQTCYYAKPPPELERSAQPCDLKTRTKIGRAICRPTGGHTTNYKKLQSLSPLKLGVGWSTLQVSGEVGPPKELRAARGIREKKQEGKGVVKKAEVKVARNELRKKGQKRRWDSGCKVTKSNSVVRRANAYFQPNVAKRIKLGPLDSSKFCNSTLANL